MSKVYKTQYERYVAQFEKTKKYLQRRGLDSKATDVLMLNKREFEFQLNRYKETRTGKASGYTNFIRQLATSQFYPRTIGQAQNLKDTLESLGVKEVNGKPLTLTNLRIFGLEELNQALKDRGIDSSYARRNYISNYVYDSK